MKESIKSYIASHASTEETLPDGWVKTTYKQDEPTIMGQRMDVCFYSNKELGVEFCISTEEDELNIDCLFPNEVLSYAQAEELKEKLQRSTKDYPLKIELLDKLPAISTFTSLTHVIIDEGNNHYTAYIAFPDLGFYYDYMHSSDGQDEQFKLMQAVRAVKENNLEEIKRFKEENEPQLGELTWSVIKDGSTGCILSSTNEASSVGGIKEAVALIQEKCPTFPKAIFQDMDQFIARQQQYYTSRRLTLLEAISSDRVRCEEHFFDIIHSTKKLTSDQLYTHKYIEFLAVWYRDHEHYDAYICIFKAVQLSLKMQYATDVSSMMTEYETNILLLSKRKLPAAVRLKLLPFFCEFVISQAIENRSDDTLILHAIALLNELSGGDDFKIPYSRDKFEKDYGSSFIVPLAKALGDSRRNAGAELKLDTNDHAKDLPQTGTAKGLNFLKVQELPKQAEPPKQKYDFF